MAITVLFYPWDEIKQKYSDDGIPFTFGEMTTEYYNKLIDGEGGTDYGFYIDNVIGRGSNIYQTFLNESYRASSFGFTRSDFTNNEESITKEKIFKYKIRDTLYAEVSQRIWLTFPENGTKVVNFFMDIIFKSTLISDTFAIRNHFSTSAGRLSYDEFIDLNNGLNPLGYMVKNGYYFGLNAYPNSTELVDASTTTTGCIIQSYQIVPSSNKIPPYIIYHGKLYIFGIGGSVILLGNTPESEKFYVPEILGSGYIPQFPPSAEDNIVGGYNNDSDEGDIPPIPEQSAIRSGMVRLYQMTTTQLNAFANFLWNTDITDWNNFMNTLKQWFSNPLDSIISLSISPVDMFYDYKTKTKTEPSPSNIKLGGFDTGVQGLQCTNNYIQISLGTLSLKPYYKSYLDCNPHTKFSLYLPYIGFKDIDGDVIFSKGATDIEVVYTIDVLTGVCVANVLIEKESSGTKLKHVIYTFSGNVNTTIPISSANMKDFISASVGAIASGIAIAGTGGASTTLVASGLAAQQGLNVASQKMNVAHSGGMALESGMFGIQYAYLIATRPREARPSNYKNLNGIPSEIGGKLITFSGFTQVSSVKVDIPNATDEEKNEIEKLLKEGIFI